MASVETNLARRALTAAVVTVAYNVLEGLISIALGAVARSPALIGFALDSFVEALSGGVMVWRFARAERLSEAEIERREARAVKLVGWTFVILGLYIAYESGEKLWRREAPAPSLGGIVLAAVSIATMYFLARYKRRLGEALGSRSLVADSVETMVCLWLSVSLLVGLGLNWTLGWWWADPVTGLVIAAFLFREGHELLTEGHCACGGSAEGEPEDSANSGSTPN